MKTYYISAIMAGLACLSLYSCEEKNPETPDTPVVPTISISLSEARETAIDFTLTPANAETVAWQIVETGTTVPGAEEIISSGNQVGTETGTYTADNLTAGTSYIIAAAALNGETYSSVATLEATTTVNEPDPVAPTLTIESAIPTRDGLTFTYSQENAEAISYVIVGGSDAIPHADDIIQEGTQVDLSQNEVVVEGLTPNTSYILAMAAQSGSAYSEVQSEHFTTMFEYQIDEDMDLTFTSVRLVGMSETENGVNRIITTFTTDDGIELTTLFYADLVDGSPATGTYNVVSTGNSEAFDIIAGNVSSGGGQFTFVQVDDSNLGAVEGGSMEIAADNISFNFVINQYYTLSGSYTGKIAAVSAIGSDLTEDVLDVFSLAECQYKMTVWSDQVRIIITEMENGNPETLGNEFWTDIMINYDGTNIIPLGTYNVGEEVVSGTASANNYTEGTTLTLKDSDTPRSEYICAPAASGTVTIAQEENGDITVSFDLYDDLGHNFTGSYTGEPTVTSWV